jgi:hypothetical protein
VVETLGSRQDILVAAFLLLAKILVHLVVAVETVLLAVDTPVVHLVAVEIVVAFLAESQEKVVEEESPFDRLDDERLPFVQDSAW